MVNDHVGLDSGAADGWYGASGSCSEYVLTLEVSDTSGKGGEDHHHHHHHHQHYDQLERVLSMAGQYEFAARDSLFSDISETLCHKVQQFENEKSHNKG